jgi:Flp pilus assembly protein TadD
VRFGIDVARRGLWREARFRFEKACLLDPDNAAALNNLAIALEQEGDFEKAARGLRASAQAGQQPLHPAELRPFPGGR